MKIFIFICAIVMLSHAHTYARSNENPYANVGSSASSSAMAYSGSSSGTGEFDSKTKINTGSNYNRDGSNGGHASQDRAYNGGGSDKRGHSSESGGVHVGGYHGGRSGGHFGGHGDDSFSYSSVGSSGSDYGIPNYGGGSFHHRSMSGNDYDRKGDDYDFGGSSAGGDYGTGYGVSSSGGSFSGFSDSGHFGGSFGGNFGGPGRFHESSSYGEGDFDMPPNFNELIGRHFQKIHELHAKSAAAAAAEAASRRQQNKPHFGSFASAGGLNNQHTWSSWGNNNVASASIGPHNHAVWAFTGINQHHHRPNNKPKSLILNKDSGFAGTFYGGVYGPGYNYGGSSLEGRSFNVNNIDDGHGIKVGASASGSIGPDGGYGSARIYPTSETGTNVRFGDDQPEGGIVNSASGVLPPISGSTYGVFTSSSSGSSTVDGKTRSFKTATVGVNNNGKVTTYTAHDP